MTEAEAGPRIEASTAWLRLCNSNIALAEPDCPRRCSEAAIAQLFAFVDALFSGLGAARRRGFIRVTCCQIIQFFLLAGLLFSSSSCR